MEQATAGNSAAADNQLLALIEKVHAGTMPPAALQEIMKHVKGLPGFSCPLVTAAGGLFWCNFSCEADDGKGRKYKWNNSLWGIGSLGGGAGGGTLYTDYTMEAIAAKTVRCAANITPVTAIATFWTDDSKLLATLTAGGYFAPAYGFTGGGSGGWS
jgi:hypothetical protein